MIPNDKTLTRTPISVVQFKTYDPGATSTAQRNRIIGDVSDKANTTSLHNIKHVAGDAVSPAARFCPIHVWPNLTPSLSLDIAVIFS